MYNVTIKFSSGDTLAAVVSAERLRDFRMPRGASVKIVKVRS